MHSEVESKDKRFKILHFYFIAYVLVKQIDNRPTIYKSSTNFLSFFHF